MDSISLDVGLKIGKYELEKKLGSGAMGSVYLATDTVLHRKVALKAVGPKVTKTGDFKARFLREARTLAKLNHPHVVQIYDVCDGEQPSPLTGKGFEGQVFAIPYLVTEFVDGENLYAIIRREGGLPWRRATSLIRQAALGLKAAAEHNLVHRDVKPGNILVAGEVAKVTDFGLAKVWDGDDSLTRAEIVLGTPDYMAPEQAMGRPIDWRSDQYALGCSLFHVLTGQTPYGHGAPTQICRKHIFEPFPSATDIVTGLPSGLLALLDAMVQKDPAKRIGSYDEVIGQLNDLIWPRATSTPRRSFVVIEVGKGAGIRSQIGERPLILGRLPECDIVLDDARVSRRHAVVQPAGNGVEVCDLGSRHGILVNGTRTKQALLQEGDRVTIGSTIVRFEQVGGSDPRMESELAPAYKMEPEPGDPGFEEADTRVEDLEPGVLKSGVPAPVVLAEAIPEQTPKPAEPIPVLPTPAGPVGDEPRAAVPAAARKGEAVLVHFTLAGASRLVSRLEAAELAEVLDRNIELIVKAVTTHRGHLINLSGEAISVLFEPRPGAASPEIRAASAALHAVDAVRKIQQAQRADRRLTIRSGVAAGPFFLTRVGPEALARESVLGQAEELARRLSTMAMPGSALITRKIREALDASFIAIDRSDVVLPGVDKDERVFELMSVHSHHPTATVTDA